jgi:hypothetical protein
MGFRDSHPRVLARPCRTALLANWGIGCKEKHLRICIHDHQCPLTYPKFTPRSSRNTLNLLDLVPNQSTA